MYEIIIIYRNNKWWPFSIKSITWIFSFFFLVYVLGIVYITEYVRSFFSFENALISVNITACQRHRIRALGLAGNPPPGTFVPLCKPDGSYDDVQCHGYTGLCWCVDGNGNEILGTRKWGRPQCTRLPPGRRIIIESIELFLWFPVSRHVIKLFDSIERKFLVGMKEIG